MAQTRESDWAASAQEGQTNPLDEDRRMRRECPVAYSADYGGFYALFRYADITEAARKPEIFSSASTITVPASHPDSAPSIPVQADPPWHRHYRAVLAPLFKGPRLESFEETLRRTATDLIDDFIADGSTELIDNYCVPLPAAGLCLLMGLPFDDWRLIHAWVVGENENIEKGDAEARRGVQQEIYEYCDTVLAYRRDHPADDVMTAMLQAEIDGEPLTREQMQGMFQVLIGAGHETVARTLGTALHYLAINVDDRDRLRAEPSLLKPAVEEFIRWGAPVRCLGRRAVADAEIGGRKIPAGSLVGMMWSSGAHDEAAYPDPDVCDFDRKPQRVNISFGVGIHRCIGEHLARLEMRVGIDEFLKRVADFEIAGDTPLSGWPTMGYNRIPIRFTANA